MHMASKRSDADKVLQTVYAAFQVNYAAFQVKFYNQILANILLTNYYFDQSHGARKKAQVPR